MKRNYVYALAALLLSGVAFTACSSEDEVVNVAAEKVQTTYSVNIPAARGGDADTRALVWGDHSLKSEWATTDKIYVVKGSGTSAIIDTNTLSPDKAGASANLVGELAGNYEVGDELTLVLGFYKSGSSVYKWLNYFNRLDSENKTIYQRGTKESVEFFDYASATVKVTAVDEGRITTSRASFAPCQSIYKFVFTDGTNPVNASSVKISSAKNKLVYTYNILEGTDTKLGTDPLALYLVNPSSDIYVAMRMDESVTEADEISFEVEDEDGYIYTGNKSVTAVPVNGKYYAARVTLTKTGKQNTFKISPEDSYTLYPNGVYSITDNATISGIKDISDNQIQMSFDNGLEVTLNNVTLTASKHTSTFTAERGTNQTIILSGTNTLENVYFYIYRCQNLTIKGTGGSLVGFKVFERDKELFEKGTTTYEDIEGQPTASLKYEDGLKFIDNGDGTYSIKKP